MSPSLITTSPGAKSVTAMCLATSRCCASVSFDVYGFACKARMISARVLCGFHPNVGSARNQQRFNVSHSFQLTHVHTHTHIHTLTHSLTHSLTPSLLHSFTPSLLDSLYVLCRESPAGDRVFGDGALCAADCAAEAVAVREAAHPEPACLCQGLCVPCAPVLADNTACRACLWRSRGLQGARAAVGHCF